MLITGNIPGQESVGLFPFLAKLRRPHLGKVFHSTDMSLRCHAPDLKGNVCRNCIGSTPLESMRFHT